MAKLKNQTQPPAPEVDFEAALQAGQDDYPEKTMKNDFTVTAPAPPDEPHFQAAMTPKKRGRPKQLQAPASPATPINNIKSYKGDNIEVLEYGVIDSDIKELKDFDIKGKLTRQEIAFLEIYFNSPRIKGKNRVTIEKAMILAGYTDYGKNWRYILAKKIMGKYARAAPDVRQIFQDLGYGQIQVAAGIIRHAESAKSESVSLNALALAARCQGMTEPKEAGGSGVQIIFNTGPAAPPEPAAPGGPAVLVVNSDGQPVAPAAPRKTSQITR
jgi:hypothetical protein